MIFMNTIDHLDLDGHALRRFLAIVEEGSITAAAERLGITQSALSHSLEKMRRIVRDPLFAKSGRGIVATAHARALVEHAHRLLDDMRQFSTGASFDPSTAELSFTIAANDFQRDLLLPCVFRAIEKAVKRASLRVIPSQSPTAAVLREHRCDLLITPLPPAGADILQKRILRDHYVCYFDAAARKAPRTREDYLAARHVTVVYTDNERLDFDRRLAARGLARDIAVSVPNFTGVPAFLKGSTLLASMPSLLHATRMAGFAAAPIPLADRRGLAELPMFMVWHRRVERDPAHRFLRDLVVAVARETGGRSSWARGGSTEPT
jgi:DNA-binding transcriptional LysR family regulator